MTEESTSTPEGERPIESHSLREQAIRIIRARIVSGQLEPGELHSIGSVAADLAVSITPVREAVQDLAKEGLIEIKRNRGFLVRTPSHEELDNIVQIRGMLEVSAVREITARGLVTDFAPLRALSDATIEHAQAGRWESFIETDRAFHLGIIEWLNNPQLVTLVGSLRDQSRLFGLDSMAGTEQFLASTKEHGLLLDTMEAKKPDEAASIMAHHLGHVRGIWAGRSESSVDVIGDVRRRPAP